MSCICEENDLYLDKDFPFKRAHHQEEKYETLVVTSGQIIFDGKFLHVMQRVCRELDTKDR